ncbi:uncharacterized protein LOC107981186 [Nasonia vitripennis]|uniref:DDE Tnp4 domain-containing protein n=1 Tax=Nasonia vitripennis TaxID=7425 RepID=A0A7M7QMD9_NASVI|nr:uncharacterized protein LOC107981186 [Nasonia vitripennis]
MAICDYKRRFTWFNFGDFGCNSDSSVFKQTDLSRLLENNRINIPKPRKITNTNIQTSFVYVNDEIFGLSEHIMKPFSRRRDLGKEEKIFNYRLSRARLNIECAFGILSEKWLILQQPLAFLLENTELVVTSSLGLHNFLLYENDEEDIEYIQENYVTEPERQSIKSGAIIRERFKIYFSTTHFLL